MNKPIKILLLVIAVIIAIGGILLFIQTRVSPPQQLKLPNQYENELSRDTKKMDDSLDVIDVRRMEASFLTILDKIDRFKKEKVIPTDVSDDYLDKTIEIYSPKFAKYCYKQFQKSVWDSDDLNWMKNRIDDIGKLTFEDDGSRVMDNFRETDNDFGTILETIENYREASYMAHNPTFHSLSDSRRQIAKSKSFSEDEYLKNNVSLAKALRGFAENLGNSHYNYLKALAERLNDYRSYSTFEAYSSYVETVENALNEYDGNANEVYGTSLNTDNIWSRASGYYEQASDYFDEN